MDLRRRSGFSRRGHKKSPQGHTEWEVMYVATIRLRRGVSAVSWAAVGGSQEAKGPLADGFDELEQDSFLGKKTWEQGESELQRRCLHRALEKGGLVAADLDLMMSGDLLNQCIGATFALRDVDTPYCGLYNACATMGEGLLLTACLIDGGHISLGAAMTSSHFCAAERQYRAPLPYGSQRSPTAQWTATAAGCCVLGRQGDGPYITHVCPGTMVDLGITDMTNMGAAMAPAAIHTLTAIFKDTGTKPQDYDLILTGDLGQVGHDIVTDLMFEDGYDLRSNYLDCGLLLYDRQKQDMHAGGSGAGCSASVLCAWLLPKLQRHELHRVIFAPTGALLSPTSSFQGESIPGICHGVIWNDKLC